MGESRVDFAVWVQDMEEQCLNWLVPKSGQVGADLVANIPISMALGAGTLVDGQSVRWFPGMVVKIPVGFKHLLPVLVYGSVEEFSGACLDLQVGLNPFSLVEGQCMTGDLADLNGIKDCWMVAGVTEDG